MTWIADPPQSIPTWKSADLLEYASRWEQGTTSPAVCMGERGYDKECGDRRSYQEISEEPYTGTSLYCSSEKQERTLRLHLPAVCFLCYGFS